MPRISRAHNKFFGSIRELHSRSISDSIFTNKVVKHNKNMHTNIKNVLGVAAIIAILAGGYAAVGYVDAFSKSIEPSSFRSFSVTGESKVVAVPDVATFTFSVINEGGKELSKLQTENTESTNKAIAFLKDKGIDAKDIQTERYSVEPRYQSFDCSPEPVFYGTPTAARLVKPCPPAEMIGYTVSQTASVKARDFSKVGEALSGVVQNGADRVSSLSFVIDDPAGVQSQAREKAIEKAKEKAEAVAKAGGFRIGRLLGIDEGGYQPYANYLNKSFSGYEALDMAAAAPVPAIEPGSQDVSVTVTLRYEIE